MTVAASLVPLPVVVPLLGAATNLVLGHRARAQRLVSIGVLIGVTATCLALLLLVDSRGTTVVQVGGWAPTEGISLVADRLAVLMLLVASTVLLAVMVFAIGQGVHDGDARQPVSIFQPAYLVLAAGVALAFLSGDLFNLYVGFEVLLTASYVLLTIGGSADRIRAGVSYVVVNLTSSLVFLVGIALCYAATGTLNLAQMATRMDEVPEGTRTALYAVLLVAFGLKAAVFPLSAWLPDSYPTAPAPVTAVFAGLLTKVGVYAIIRAHTLLFPQGSLDNVLMVAGLLTMLVGILGAIAQNDIKRLISFTLVSHIGYMIFGIALSTRAGLAGAVFYVVHHIVVQTTLFLVVGIIERQGGSASLRRLGQLASTAPLIGVLFLLPALNLGGIPPFSGFIGKVALLEAGVSEGGVLPWALVTASVVTSLLTLYVMARVWTKAFWRSRADAPEGHLDDSGPVPEVDGAQNVAVAQQSAVGPIPIGMLVPTAGMVVVSILLSVFAGPLYGLTERAADTLIDRTGYITSVLGTRGSDS